jgi:hypothetical protein
MDKVKDKSDGQSILFDEEKGKSKKVYEGEEQKEIQIITDHPSSFFSTKAERQEMFIPVSGFVWLYPEEVKVINHPVFQRLGRIYQLGQTYLLYRGATHKRLEHSIGTMHMVQKMIDAVSHTCEKYKIKNSQSIGASIQNAEERFIRLGALLHDIGHVAFGHTVEDELFLINKHDSDERLNLLLRDENKVWRDTSGNTLGELIDKEYLKYIPDDLASKEVTSSQIVRLLIRKHPDREKDEFIKTLKLLEESSSLRLNICRDMIGNTICADILDYIHRDWYHIGKQKPIDERILQYMEIHTETKNSFGQVPEPDKKDQFVVSLGKRPKIRTDAVSAILELLEWRYQLAESVLFHRTKLAAASMLDRALFELWEDKPKEEIEEIILPLSEDQMLSRCLDIARGRGDERGKIAEQLFYALENRQLFTSLCTFSFDDLDSDIRDNVRNMYAKSKTVPNMAPLNRANVLRLLENDFGLCPGSITMYCPTAGMNVKIAEVKIKVNEVVDQFAKYEEAYENRLSGGHLDAQLKRFTRLWRVHFFIERKEKERIKDWRGHLITAINKLVLNNIGDGETKEDIVNSLATSMTIAKESPWQDCAVLDEVAVAAFRKPLVQYPFYPFGAKSIRNYILNKTDAPKA